MLTITIPAIELYDDDKQEFVSSKAYTLQLEHSLVAISKWESKWCIPFLSKNDKTFDETIDYIKCMTITQNVDPAIYNTLSHNIVNQVSDYIKAPMTATTITSVSKTHGKEIITAEILYYYMVALNIPFECQKWHLNRLLTLISVCNLKTNPPKKMGKNDIINRNKELNAARRNMTNSKG